MRVQVGRHWYVVELDDIRSNPVRVLVDGEPVELEVEGLPAGEVHRPPTAAADTTAGQATVMRAPMPGVIVSVAVRVGQRVSAGDQLCVLETIKLEQALRAPVAAIVRTIHVEPGQSVTTGQVIVELG
ncbi:MAG: DUF2118 domain-containing protein [Dehalococcoidia bacterium]